MKQKLSPEDLRLWKSQLKDVKPLSKKGPIPEEPSLPKKSKPPQPQPRSLERKVSLPPSPAPLQDFGRKELRHLKINGRLDMHGMTKDEAYDALERFLKDAQEKGFKIVLIITGKGALHSENTLRHHLPRWINETPLRHLVSSFHSPAQPQHGGHGACYVGVRKQRK